MKSRRENWMSFEGEDLASELETYHNYYRETSLNPVYKSVVRNTYAYYSTILDAESWFTALNFVGEQGELVKMSVPQSRGLIRQLVTLLCKQKLAFNAVADVGNKDVSEELRIANAIASDICRTQELDLKQEILAERGLVQGTGFIKATWRSDLGEPRAVEDLGEGKRTVLYEGDLEISMPSFFDVVYDFTIEHWKDLDWVDVRVKRNRWDLIAQHPDLEDEILKLPSVNDSRSASHVSSFDSRDMVYVWELYHRPTPSLPQGRMFVRANAKTIFYDDINPYKCIPIEQLKPEPIEGINYGYPMLSNLLPAQEMYDHSYSCIATNQSALGVQNIANPSGSNVNVQVVNGMNFINYQPQPIPGGGKLEPLDLLKTAPEMFKLPEMLLQNMQQLSFINAAVRGELPASTSGVAIATLTTNAIEFLSSYSKTLQKVMQNIVFHGVKAYHRFAKVERLVRVVGQNYQTFSRPFTGDMLDPITAIEMQTINPLMQTVGGRLDIAEKALEKGLVRNLQQYVSIIEGQPLNKLYKQELSQNDLIQAENERLSQGELVKALSTDKHAQHIYEHSALLNDPQIRLNSPLVQNINEHLMEHLMLQKTTDPLLMAMATTGMVPNVPMAPMDASGGEFAPQMPAEAPTDAQPGEGSEFAEKLKPKTAQPAERGAEDLLGRA